MAYSVWVGNLRTGRRITQIPVSGGRWSSVLRRGGDIEVTIPLGAREFQRHARQLIGGLYPGPFVFPSPTTYPQAAAPVWRPDGTPRPGWLSAVDVARCFLGVLDDDQVLEAGPIWAHRYDAGTDVLTLRAAGLRSVFDLRRVMGVVATGMDAATWQATYGDWSLATIAKRLIQLLMSHTHGELPINLPDDEPGTHTRTYYGHDLGTVGGRLDELMAVEGGPDLELTPRITADRMGIAWDLRTGTEADPLVHQRSGDWIRSGGDWTWDAQVPKGGVQGLSVDVDGRALASRSWVSGAGAQEALLMEWADDDTLTSRGYPMLEQAESRHTIENRATAAAWARSNAAAQARPWQTWDLTVSADTAPKLGTYRPGDFGRLYIPADHPYLGWRAPEGYHRTRLLGMSGHLDTRLVNLLTAPTMTAR